MLIKKKALLGELHFSFCFKLASLKQAALLIHGHDKLDSDGVSLLKALAIWKVSPCGGEIKNCPFKVGHEKRYVLSLIVLLGVSSNLWVVLIICNSLGYGMFTLYAHNLANF